jgi:hypothetical protein
LFYNLISEDFIMTKLGTTKNTSLVQISPPNNQSWRKPFLAGLADTSNVRAAAKAANVSSSHVYRTRREDEDFARDWQAALCEGYDNLEMELLCRLRQGELTPAKDAKRSTRKFDNAVSLRLLAAHNESAAKHRAAKANVSAAIVSASIERKVETMRKQMQAKRRGEA